MYFAIVLSCSFRNERSIAFQNHFSLRICFRLFKTDGLFTIMSPSVGHLSIFSQSAQVSSFFSRTQLCTGQSLSQNGVFAPSVRQPVQFIISGVIVTPDRNRSDLTRGIQPRISVAGSVKRIDSIIRTLSDLFNYTNTRIDFIMMILIFIVLSH